MKESHSVQYSRHSQLDVFSIICDDQQNAVEKKYADTQKSCDIALKFVDRLKTSSALSDFIIFVTSELVDMQEITILPEELFL